MSEVTDQCIQAEILLSRGDHVAKGNIVAQSHDANGNAMCRAHAHPILDIRMYELEFAGGEIIEFTTNVIPESIYAQYNAERNE